MLFSVDIPEFKRALTVVKPAVPRRGGLPVLFGAKLEARGNKVAVTATNLDMAITTVVAANVGRAGTAVIPYKTLVDLVHGKGDVAVEVDDDETVTIRNGAVSRARILPADEYPRIPADGDFPMQYPLDLRRARQVLGAASGDSSRPILCGVFFDGSDMAATDSYRLHVSRRDTSTFPKVLVPASTLAAVAAATKGDEATMLLSAEHHGAWAQFRIPGMVHGWTARLIDGEYPNYGVLLPTSEPPHGAVFDRNTMLEAVRQAASIIVEISTPVSLTFDGDAVQVAVDEPNAGRAEATVAARCSGPPVTIGFNPKFFADALRATGPNSRLGVIDSLKAATVTDADSDDGFVGLVMPIRLPDLP